MSRSLGRRSVWPVWLLALPAAVAIWSGWVELAGLCGFGLVRPLPGLVDELVIDSRITLPVGMEAYAALALRSWLDPHAPEAARRFARVSAVGALALGAAGQVAYHLMSAAGVTAAPWPVTALVACIPVAVLGAGAALAHLTRHPDGQRTRTGTGTGTERAGERLARATPAVVQPVRPRRTPAPGALERRASSRSSGTTGGTSSAPGSWSTRERVAVLLGSRAGVTAAQVAAELGLSERTARRHLAALREHTSVGTDDSSTHHQDGRHERQHDHDTHHELDDERDDEREAAA